MREINVDNLDDIAIGAAVLGTGGGGNPYIGKLMAREAIKKYGPVKLIDPGELDDSDVVIPTGMMGAPTVMVEKLPEGQEVVRAFQELERHLGVAAKATMSCEVGGLNSVTPFTVAAQLGIPVVDADMMGRAFPELQMATPTIYGIPATPMAIADEKGNHAILKTLDNRWAETLARTMTIDMGCSSMIAIFSMTGEQVKQSCVRNSLTLAENIGIAIRRSRSQGIEPIEALRNLTEAFVIWQGRVVDVQRRTATGFARGNATIAGIGEYYGRRLEIAFQNEYLIARADDNEVLISTPDLITILDTETGEPITTESLRYGFPVTVIGLPCDDRWRTEQGLSIVGPSYFGYDANYIPIEARY